MFSCFYHTIRNIEKRLTIEKRYVIVWYIDYRYTLINIKNIGKGNTMKRKNKENENCKERAIFVKGREQDKGLLDKRYFQYYKGSSLWVLNEILEHQKQKKS